MVVVFGFLFPVLFELYFDFFVKFVLLVVKVLDCVVINLLLVIVDSLQVLELLSQSSQFLDLRSKLLLLVLDLTFNILDNASDFLQSVIFPFVQNFVLLRDTHYLVLDLGISSDSLFLFEVLHKFSKIVGSGLQDFFSS